MKFSLRCSDFLKQNENFQTNFLTFSLIFMLKHYEPFSDKEIFDIFSPFSNSTDLGSGE